MSVQSVSQKSFDQLHPRRRSSWAEQDVEWFIERSRTLIAYIERTIGVDDWRVVIEGRDEHGEFYGIESVDGLSSQEDARTVIEKRINDIMATGLKVFPRFSGVRSR